MPRQVVSMQDMLMSLDSVKPTVNEADLKKQIQVANDLTLAFPNMKLTSYLFELGIGLLRYKQAEIPSFDASQ